MIKELTDRVSRIEAENAELKKREDARRRSDRNKERTRQIRQFRQTQAQQGIMSDSDIVLETVEYDEDAEGTEFIF